MSATLTLRRFIVARRVRQLAVYALWSLPLAMLVVVLTRALAQPWPQVLMLSAVVIVIAVLVIDYLRASRRASAKNICQHFDTHFPQLENSTALLLAKSSSLSRLGALQRERTAEQWLVLSRAETAREYLPTHAMSVAFALVFAALIANSGWLIRYIDTHFAWPVTSEQTPLAMISDVQIDVRMPAYTRVGEYSERGASIDVLDGASIRWTLTSSEPIEGLQVSLGEQSVVRLFSADERRWQSAWWPAQTMVYEFVADKVGVLKAGEEGRVHRVFVSDDAAPTMQVDAPRQTVEVISPTSVGGLQREVALTASDDFGLTRIVARTTLAAGEGEQIDFTSQEIEIYADGEGVLVQTTVSRRLDLSELGLRPGAELFIALEVADNREPVANTRIGETLIFKMPALAKDDEADVDGQIIQVMPEYFRSQRQIIIDSEALIAARESISVDKFNARAQSLAFDQKALRIRYGEFLGEEDNFDEVLQFVDADGETHTEDDGHDHAGHADEPGFNQGANEFGDRDAAIGQNAHFHDRAEQATLFDPDTRELLRGALNAMWSSERELRMFAPAPSLPHQHRALDLIKQVQNRSRIYLARVGFKQVPVDEQRRYSGELDEINQRTRVHEDKAGLVETQVGEFMQALTRQHKAPSAEQHAAVLQWLEQRRSADKDAAKSIQIVQEAMLEWGEAKVCEHCVQTLLSYWWQTYPAKLPGANRATREPDIFLPVEAATP